MSGLAAAASDTAGPPAAGLLRPPTPPLAVRPRLWLLRLPACSEGQPGGTKKVGPPQCLQVEAWEPLNGEKCMQESNKQERIVAYCNCTGCCWLPNRRQPQLCARVEGRKPLLIALAPVHQRGAALEAEAHVCKGKGTKRPAMS